MLYEATGNYYKDTLKKFMMRVFVAADITDKVVVESIVRFQSLAGIPARAVKPHNLHFTFQFLGEISPDMVEKTKISLNSVKFSNFTVNFSGIGVFPGPKSPRVVWVGTDEDSGRRLEMLAGKVNVALGPLGFSRNGQFRPHVTVFRVKKKINDVNDLLKRYESVKFGKQEISNIKLKQSVNTLGGMVYSDLEEIASS